MEKCEFVFITRSSFYCSADVLHTTTPIMGPWLCERLSAVFVVNVKYQKFLSGQCKWTWTSGVMSLGSAAIGFI